MALVLLTALVRAEDKPITLLFAGRSSTYWNDFPREVAKIVDKKLQGHVPPR